MNLDEKLADGRNFHHRLIFACAQAKKEEKKT